MKNTKINFEQLKKCLKESNSEDAPYYNMLSVDTWEDLYDMLGKAFRKWPELKERKVMVSNKNALIEYPFGMQFVIGPNKPKMYLVAAENFRDRLVSKEFDRVPLDEDLAPQNIHWASDDGIYEHDEVVPLADEFMYIALNDDDKAYDTFTAKDFIDWAWYGVDIPPEEIKYIEHIWAKKCDQERRSLFW